jgi:hypothetical protein
MLILTLLILVLLIIKYGVPGTAGSDTKVWNRTGMMFIGTLVFLFVAIFLRHM